jgi:hypothetical protein
VALHGELVDQQFHVTHLRMPDQEAAAVGRAHVVACPRLAEPVVLDVVKNVLTAGRAGRLLEVLGYVRAVRGGDPLIFEENAAAIARRAVMSGAPARTARRAAG